MNSKELSKVFSKLKVDALISEAPQTRQWYAGIETSDGWLIIEKDSATLFVDGRYLEYATNNAKNVEVKLLKDDSLKKWLKNKKFEKIAIEEDYLSVEKLNIIKKMIKIDDSSIIPINSQKLRIIKSNEELSKTQKAIDISLEAFEKLQIFIKEGISEKELKHKLEYIMVRCGAEKEAFDSIVAFAENTAEPHHHSSNKTLKKGDMVTIDFGAKFEGYCADITRTFIFEENQNESINKKYREILNIVEEAAKLGRESVKPGVKTSEIDKICRDYIASKGYSNFFVHSTGHGLGLDVHEFPYVSSKSDIVLKEGMIITIEPGIYIEKIGGARIEDDVLVTIEGAKVLSRK